MYVAYGDTLIKYVSCLVLSCITGWGRIINMASMMGIISGPELAAYSACKSALIGLTKVCFVRHQLY